MSNRQANDAFVRGAKSLNRMAPPSPAGAINLYRSARFVLLGGRPAEIVRRLAQPAARRADFCVAK
jgi:hypothetical protein